MTNADDVARASAKLGQTVGGKYRLRRVLGVGGMGAVYEAAHAITGKRVAVKVLDPRGVDSEGYAARFLREARIAAQIGHPGIVDVIDAGQEPGVGTLYLVLELLEGEDFGAAIRRKDLRLEEIVEVGIQTLDALGAAHDRGIIHRDVKPENVFLTRDDKGALRVKVLDFGVAKSTRGTPDLYTTQAGQIVGTPYYMSPEQAAGENVDRRTDVWSVGAMLFHALAGRPPFDDTHYNRLILKLINERPPPLRAIKPGVPEWVARVVDGALVPREERWQSVLQMAEGLRRRGDVPIGLDWEKHEDETLQTASPFQDAQPSLPPPPSLDLANTAPSSPAVAIPAQPSVAETVAARGLSRSGQQGGVDAGAPTITPRLRAEEQVPAPATTPQTWERQAPRAASSAGLPVIWILIAAVIVIGVVGGIGVAVGAYVVMRGGTSDVGPVSPGPFPAPAPLLLPAIGGATDAGVDAGG